MVKKSLLFIVVFCITILGHAQELNPNQKAWLYKIVSKTPSLNRNWDEFFVYHAPKPNSFISYYTEDGHLTTKKIDIWPLIEDTIIKNPDILSIDLASVKNSSPGLIADASVRLTLWELYSNLKAGFEEDIPFTINPTANYFYKEMVKAFPENCKKNGEIRIKYRQVLFDILNPSHQLRTKIKSVDQLKKVSIQQKKNILDRWNRVVTTFVAKRTNEYFKYFAGEDIYYKGQLLAVGDGSGTSGLLNEFEPAGELDIETGTGRGIGLFTYKIKSRNSKLFPEEEGQYTFRELEEESILFHLALWGIDGRNKPLIRITKGGKSYILFNALNGDLCPDKNFAIGMSYYDQIESFRQKEIIEREDDLQKDGGLLQIYNKEVAIRDEIKRKLDELGLEIDSLQKNDEVSELAIQNRKNKIDVNLSNLSDKEKRLVDLQRKISTEYSRINEGQKRLTKMKDDLGVNIQDWQEKDSVYYFTDGTEFNMRTQDLIFFKDSIQEDIEVKLIAASFSLKGERKDEVQLYVNTTGGVDDYKKRMAKSEKFQNDTVVRKTIYFASNSFKCTSILTPTEEMALSQIIIRLDSVPTKVFFELTALGIDTVHHQNIEKDKKEYQSKKQEDKFRLSRRVDLLIVNMGDSVLIKVDGFTDAGNTNLNELTTGGQLNEMQWKTTKQTLNPLLSALRVNAIVQYIANSQNLSLNGAEVFVKPLERSFNIEKIDEIVKP